MPKTFKFAIGDTAVLSHSGETGEIIGRAEYANNNEDTYLLRYKAADGRQVEAWHNESAFK